MTTQHDLIASELLSARIPLLRETSLVIADPQVRYVGTLGGNLANGDPGNDMPAVMMCLGASYQVEDWREPDTGSSHEYDSAFGGAKGSAEQSQLYSHRAAALGNRFMDG
jgi:hypothetical protein